MNVIIIVCCLQLGFGFERKRARAREQNEKKQERNWTFRISKQRKSYKKINDDGKVVAGRGERKPVAVTIKLLTNSVQIVSSNDHLI